jgi:hypothetical protein
LDLARLLPAMIESAGQDPVPDEIDVPDFPLFNPLLNSLPQRRRARAPDSRALYAESMARLKRIVDNTNSQEAADELLDILECIQ